MSDSALSAGVRAHLELGASYQSARNLAAALREYQLAAQLAPDSEAVFAALGSLAMDAQDWVAAERIHGQLEKRFPGRHRARLALALFNQQRYRDALPVLQAMADTGNMDSNCALAYAVSLERCGDPDRSVQVMTSIWRGTGSEHMAVLLASALLRLGRRSELDRLLPELLAAFPANGQLLGARSEHGFLSGDYATGFDYIQHRWALALEPPKAAQLPCPVWAGQRFAGNLLVTAEQGLGDEILSSSMFEELVRIGQPAVIDCEPRLLPVFRRSFPALQFTDRKGNELAALATDPAARKIEALELGRFFRRDITAMPQRRAWLAADPARTAHWRQWLADRFPGRRAIGLSWRSNRHLLGDSKSIPLADLAPLLRDPELACVSLQYGDISADLASLPAELQGALYQAPGLDTLQDIDGLFALTAALTAVATCSNTTAHIGGALGVPTFGMLPGSRYVLWYWGHDGASTPWYPALQLFRGPPRRAWSALAGDVADAIRQLPANGSGA